MTAVISAAVVGFAYGIAPGPGVLAVLGIGADRGRRAGAAFLGGHFIGDLIWYCLALISIIGASSIDRTIFRVLGVLSGLYLIYIGLRALVQAGHSAAASQTSEGRPPFIFGLAFGATNPKSYPVAAALFTALLNGHAQSLTWSSLPRLLGAASLGSFTAYAVLVLVIGLGGFRAVYRRHATLIKRTSGIMFIAFGGRSIADSIRR